MSDGHFLTFVFGSNTFKIMMSVIMLIFACGVAFMLPARRPAKTPTAEADQ
jgi:hypothetical protein